jgi:ferredoxin
LPPANYHHESFDFATRQVEEDTQSPTTELTPSFTVTFAKTQRSFVVRADETALKATKAAGLAPASSCATGLCGTCKTRKISGLIEMSHQRGIRKREIDAGLFLPCCSEPLSDLVLDR